MLLSVTYCNSLSTDNSLIAFLLTFFVQIAAVVFVERTITYVITVE